MNQQAQVPAPCQGRTAVAAAELHQARLAAAESICDEVQGGLAGFTDSFMDAVASDFLAETDERRLRDKYRNQPTTLASRLAANRRTLGAQRALHVLYNKLLAGAAMTIEERVLAEHARDLADSYAIREIERRRHQITA
ncbi:MAG: hypothetical protein ACHQIO_07935 [Nevskiales bacterium]